MKKEGYYSSGQFAGMAHVTLRTIRYYDKQGILKPSFVRHPQFFPRLCLKKAFCKMFVTICENDFSNRL